MESVRQMLPSFNSEHRALYERCRQTLADVDALRAVASAAGHSEDVAAMGSYRDALATGLSRKKFVDATESVAIAAMEVGSIGFPLALFGGAPALYAAAGCFSLGMVLYLVSIVDGRGYPDRAWASDPAAIRGGATLGRYRLQREQQKVDAAAAQARVNQKVQEFGKTLQEISEKPGVEPIRSEPERVIIHGVPVPVQRSYETADTSVIL